MSGPNFTKTYQSVCSITTTDDFFTLDYVDSGILFWTFSRFSAGAQAVTAQSSKMELFYDADGSGNNLELIDAIYTNGETYQHEFNTSVTYPYTPNVSRVLIRRTCFGSPVLSREIFAQWQGVVV